MISAERSRVGSGAPVGLAVTCLVRHLEEVLGVALLVTIGLVVLVQIVSRYILAAPVKWSEELARVLLAWLTFVGASSVLKSEAHPRMSEIRTRASPRARLAFDLFADLCFAVLLLYGAYYGFRLAANLTQIKLVTMNASWAWWYSAFPVGATLMLLRLLQKNRRLLGWRPAGVVGAHGSGRVRPDA